jgi:hypothetical protein
MPNNTPCNSMSSSSSSSTPRKWFRRPRWLIVCLLVGLYAIPRLWTTVRFAGQAHVPDLDGDFARIDSLLPAADSQIASFHRGLPHNLSDPSAFLRAVWLSPTWSYHGYRFQFAEWRPSPAFRSVVQGALTQKRSFNTYGGPKACGGYHADFVAEFATSDGPVQFMVCLGCHEVLVFGPHGSSIVELSQTAYDSLLKAWRDETD